MGHVFAFFVIFFCLSVCQEYFMDGGMRKVLEKDEKATRHAAASNGAPLNAQPDSSLPRFATGPSLCIFVPSYFYSHLTIISECRIAENTL